MVSPILDVVDAFGSPFRESPKSKIRGSPREHQPDEVVVAKDKGVRFHSIPCSPNDDVIIALRKGTH
jgi:hypothetical protein